jgi:hypothetical protein
MEKAHKTILPVLVNTLAIVALTITPALAKDSHNKKSSHLPSQRDALKTGHQDEKSRPAWKTIGETAKNGHGDIYAVEDYEGNQVTLRVGQGMKRINKKKVGDPVRAEITRGGLGNSIQ